MATTYEGKRVLLSGAGSGLGRAIAIRLASDGAAVHGIDVNDTGLGETLELVADAGGWMTSTVGTITDKATCSAAVREAAGEHGLDVLGNVAGVVTMARFVELDEAEWRRQLDVNLTGAFLLTQAAMPGLIRAKGNVVNIASSAAFLGQAYTAAYCASKAGLLLLTKSLAIEFIKEGVRVNAICPNGMNTSMIDPTLIPPDLDPDLLARLYSPNGQNSDVADVAGIFAFLASDTAVNVTGASFNVDGGRTAG